MDLYRVVYASQPFGFDGAMLNGILADARRCNLRDDITGALICRSDLYLQWLEGPEPAVRAAYGRIVGDNRHTDIHCVMSGPVEDRLFPGWAMRDDPARSWMWSPTEVAFGAAKQADEAEIFEIFQRVARSVP